MCGKKEKPFIIKCYIGDYGSYTRRHLKMIVDGHAVGLTITMAINTFL